MQLRAIVEGTTYDKEIREVEDALLLMNKPKSFTEASNAEIAYDKDFSHSLTLIQEQLGVDGRKMSTLEYYNALDYLKIKRNGTR